MKKSTRKILSVMTAFTCMASAMSITAYAENGNANAGEGSAVEVTGVISDDTVIEEMLSEFITESGLAARTFVKEDMFDGVVVEIQEYWNDKETIEPIKEFIAENNIDESRVEFIVLENSVVEVTTNANPDITVTTTTECSDVLVADPEEWPFENLTPIDDKGMFGDYYEREYQMCYSKNKFVYKYIPIWNKFEFQLSNRVDKDEVHDKVVGIIKKYLPDAEISNMFNDKSYSVYVTLKSNVNKEDEIVQNGIEMQEKIFDELVEENLISKFYKLGSIYQEVPFVCLEDFKYSIDSDSEQISAIEAYLEENNTGCTLVKEEAGFYEGDAYVVKPADDMEYKDFFKVATDIYELTELVPAYLILEIYTEVYSANTYREYVLENQTAITGDANNDNELSVRDCACIASAVAGGFTEELGTNADFNKDEAVNVRDAASLANHIVNKK